jgi:hypothetical protein
MIKKGVKDILPESYDLEGASWYETINKDYDLYSYTVLLTSYLISITIPISFLIYELYNGRTGLLLNYFIPSVVMTLMIFFLVI